jgi:uncharacterized protein (TIGR03437 family)
MSWEAYSLYRILKTIAMICVSAGLAHAAIPASERQTLVSVYAATKGIGWTNSANWNLVAGTECFWFGVTCDNAGATVISLALINNNLVGTIPSLSGLQNLRQVQLQGNLLTGSIPSFAGMNALQAIYLQNNQLTGTIPPVTGLPNLTTLFLSNNALSGGVPDLTGMTKLSLLYLDHTQVSGTIPSLSGLTSLTGVRLGGNQLTGPLPSLDGLTSLTELDLNTNQLTGTIPSLRDLTKLTLLDLSNNQLSGPIPSLATLTKMTTARLNSNQLTGQIPDLTTLSSLGTLLLNTNQLTGQIPSFAGLFGLQQVDFSNNQLSGTIPSLTNNTGLNKLALHDNQLTGTIPPISALTKLTIVQLQNNQLTGTIPALTGLNLLSITLGNNRLYGNIPTAPKTLTANGSSLCPNFLTVSDDPKWDTATGVTPWSQDCTSAPAPRISTGGVVELNSPANIIQPGSWISIYGSNLALGQSVWNSDFPISLGGTTVTVNGKSGYLWFVSPGQINLQAPDDTAVGSVQVQVTTPFGSTTSTVTLAPVAPSFNLLANSHVAAIILRPSGNGAFGTYDVVGPTGSSLGYPTVAAKAGDLVEVFGVGFGPTTPDVAAGRAFSGSATTKNPVQFIINGRTIVPDFAGLSAAGLYQFNLTIPAGLGTGDQPIQAVVSGVRTPVGAVISLQ